jgi:isocitrate/isopropylmalate dehydrogenase
MFEAVHGSAPDIAGQKRANPTALLFSALMMLEHLGHDDIAERIRNAVISVLKDQKSCTADIGGEGDTFTYADAICLAL